MSVDESMPNLLSSVPMPVLGRHLMFCGHLDVLPAGDDPGRTDDPWSGKVADGRVWGHGASDRKGGVTAMLFAYASLSRLRGQLTGRLSIVLAWDEETGMGRSTWAMLQQNESAMAVDGDAGVPVCREGGDGARVL